MLQSPALNLPLRCPRCRAEIEIGEGVPRCARCGARYARHGSVLDFLDGGAGDPSTSPAIAAFARRVVDDPGGFRESLKQAGDEGDALRGLAGRIDLEQVLHDVDRIRFGSEFAESPYLDFLLEHARPDAEGRVLDVGASCGRHLWELRGRTGESAPRTAVALDINPIVLAVGERVWEARHPGEGPAWVRGDALRLPFRDATFTHVLSNVTMILLPFAAALAEFRRVLAPGGRLIFTMEGPGGWRHYWDDAPPRSRRRFNLLRARLGNALLKLGIDWQTTPGLRRLSMHSQFDPPTVRRFVGRAGLTVERCDVYNAYKDQPWVIMAVARRPD